MIVSFRTFIIWVLHMITHLSVLQCRISHFKFSQNKWLRKLHAREKRKTWCELKPSKNVKLFWIVNTIFFFCKRKMPLEPDFLSPNSLVNLITKKFAPPPYFLVTLWILSEHNFKILKKIQTLHFLLCEDPGSIRMLVGTIGEKEDARIFALFIVVFIWHLRHLL